MAPGFYISCAWFWIACSIRWGSMPMYRWVAESVGTPVRGCPSNSLIVRSVLQRIILYAILIHRLQSGQIRSLRRFLYAGDQEIQRAYFLL